MVCKNQNIFKLTTALLLSGFLVSCNSSSNSDSQTTSTATTVEANTGSGEALIGELEIDPNLHTVDTIPADFVNLQELIPDIVYDLKYGTNDNFMGRPVPGYEKPVAYATVELANRLAMIQKELRSNGVGLKVFDAYRPQRAVNSFIAWAKDINDQKEKSRFYPDYKKEDLFRSGFISTKSNHSRGVAIDVTMIIWDTKEEIDMGTPFDFFGKLSNHDVEGLTKQQVANRNYLGTIMLKYGFEPYSQEWWHYTIPTNLHEDTYYDFPLN